MPHLTLFNLDIKTVKIYFIFKNSGYFCILVAAIDLRRAEYLKY